MGRRERGTRNIPLDSLTEAYTEALWEQGEEKEGVGRLGRVERKGKWQECSSLFRSRERS